MKSRTLWDENLSYCVSCKIKIFLENREIFGFQLWEIILMPQIHCQFKNFCITGSAKILKDPNISSRESEEFFIDWQWADFSITSGINMKNIEIF